MSSIVGWLLITNLYSGPWYQNKRFSEKKRLPTWRVLEGESDARGRRHALYVFACLTVWRLQQGPPKDFQPIRNRSLNKELSVRTSSGTVLFFDLLVQLFSFPLNCIFLFLQLEVTILDLGPEDSLVKKKRPGKSFFNRNTCVQQEKIPALGVALGAVFIKKTRSNYPISLVGRTGIKFFSWTII